MLHRHILHNETIREATDPVLSPGQVGLLSGWGVFTTLRVSEGVLFAWERHWARIMRDAAAFHVSLPADPEKLRRRLLDLVEVNGAQTSTLRLVIVRNGGGMWANPAPERESDVIALTADTKDWGRGVKLAYQRNARHAASPFSGTKILSWSMNLTWLETAQQRGFDEVILLNERGEVAECTSANIFVANGTQVWTPPLSSGCLPGITREVLLGEVHLAGYTARGKSAYADGSGVRRRGLHHFDHSRSSAGAADRRSEDRPKRRSARSLCKTSSKSFYRRYVAAAHKEVPASR